MPPNASSEKPTMKLAEILSDLTSLRVCDPAAALALVSARPSNASSSTGAATSKNVDATAEAEADPDLQRAKDVVELHYAVKEAHQRGQLGQGLEEARRAVEKAVG